MPAFMHTVIKTEDILAATGPAFDAYSYHSYGAVSSRCEKDGWDNYDCRSGLDGGVVGARSKD